jgi:transposase-like protein
MGKARKVFTPGSRPPGRPKKVKEKKGTARKGNYRTRYEQENMARAIEQVKKKRMSIREAAKEYEVPRATLHDRVKENVKETLGRPTVLSNEEESMITERLLLMGEWGFPLTCKDLRLLIKAYLDGMGRTSRQGSLFCIYFTLFLPLFSYSFPFPLSSFFFPLSSFFFYIFPLFPFSYFFPK